MLKKIAFLLVLGFWLVACEDPLTKARRKIKDDPKEALELIAQAKGAKEGCKECPLYASMAYQRLGNRAAAEKELETFIKNNENTPKIQLVMGELYRLYEADFNGATKDIKKLELSEKAQKIERHLNMANGFSGMFLLEYHEKMFNKALDTDMLKLALKHLNAIKTMFVDPVTKKQTIKRVNKRLKQYFVKKFTPRLQLITNELADKGLFSIQSKTILLANRFIVPKKSKDPMFDPQRKDFELRVRVGACKPLRAKLDTVVKSFYAHAPLKLKKYNKKLGDRLFQAIFVIAKAGYDVPKADSKPKNGLPFKCFIRVKPVDFVNYLYLLWDFKV